MLRRSDTIFGRRQLRDMDEMHSFRKSHSHNQDSCVTFERWKVRNPQMWELGQLGMDRGV